MTLDGKPIEESLTLSDYNVQNFLGEISLDKYNSTK